MHRMPGILVPAAPLEDATLADGRTPDADPRIGLPVTFLDGAFAGQTIRAQLREIQKAEVGRKYFRKDRRPLDPPPTCLLELFFVHNPGTPTETHTPISSYEDIRPEGWVCHVDMFSAPAQPRQDGDATHDPVASPNGRRHATGRSRRAAPQSDGEPTGSSSVEPEPAMDGVEVDGTADEAADGDVDADADADDDSGESMESETLAAGLAGSTFTQAVKITVAGAKALVFTFTDLSAKHEGSFRLRYRCFNVLSCVVGAVPRPVLAECVGGAFTVYSTKKFPGLGPSTDLTKTLSDSGIRVNKRETVRKSTQHREQADGHES